MHDVNQFVVSKPGTAPHPLLTWHKRCNAFRTCAKMHFTEKNILGLILCPSIFKNILLHVFFFKDVVTSCSELVPEFLQSNPSVLRGIKSVVCAEGGTSLEENLYKERLATCTFYLLMTSGHVYLYEDPRGLPTLLF